MIRGALRNKGTLSCGLRCRLSLLVILLCGCAETRASVVRVLPPPSAPSVPQRTCLVLSVGGYQGPAHFGAIEAVKAAQIKIDCVVGTSFGAVAGSMFVTAPNENVGERYLRFADQYVERTKREKGDAALSGAAIAGILGAIITGGSGLVVGALVGGSAGAGTVNERDRQRFQTVLNKFYGGASIETSSMAFATLHQKASGTGMQNVPVTSGNLADAVASSAANPFIFQDVKLRAGERLDPGADRVAAIPVDDACRFAPDAQLIVINLRQSGVLQRGHAVPGS